MYLVLIAWMYVTVMMAIAEAASSNGTLLGAIFTLLLYGVLPLALVLYLWRTPARRKALRARQAAESVDPDAGGHAAAATERDTVAPVREEP
ncbi:MAG: hypothetical protein ABI343_18635 [Burkholderiaceae bacterium]